MGTPVAYDLWAPQAPQLDASPLVEGAKVAAAGYMAAGNAVGEAIAKSAKQKHEENAQEAIGDMMEHVGSSSNYETKEIDPSLLDPTLVTKDGIALDRIGRQQAITERFEAMGYPHEIASAKALEQTTPQVVKVMKPGAVDKVRGLQARAMSMARKAGYGPEEIAKALELVRPQAFESDTEANAAAVQSYVGRMSPPQAELSMLQASLTAQRDQRQFERENVARKLDVGDKRDLIEFQSSIEERLDKAKRSGETEQQMQLLQQKNTFDLGQLRESAKLDKDTRLAVEDAKGKIDLLVASAKGGGTTPEEQKSLRRFSAAMQQGAVSQEAFNAVPLRSVGGLEGNLKDYVRSSDGGTILKGGLGGLLGNEEGADVSGVQVAVGEDGKVHMHDAGGNYSDEQLEKVARRMFDSPQATYAVVLQQFNGAGYFNSNDLSQLMDVHGGDALEAARLLLAVGASKAQARQEKAKGAGTITPASGQDVIDGLINKGPAPVKK